MYLLRCNVNSTEYRSVETSKTRKRVFFREKWQISSSSSESESFNHSYGADVRKYSDYGREVQLSPECVYAKRAYSSVDRGSAIYGNSVADAEK